MYTRFTQISSKNVRLAIPGLRARGMVTNLKFEIINENSILHTFIPLLYTELQTYIQKHRSLSIKFTHFHRAV